jgi:hypothetical protein
MWLPRVKHVPYSLTPLLSVHTVITGDRYNVCDSTLSRGMYIKS